jgi:hypothetical protein
MSLELIRTIHQMEACTSKRCRNFGRWRRSHASAASRWFQTAFVVTYKASQALMPHLLE